MPPEDCIHGPLNWTGLIMLIGLVVVRWIQSHSASQSHSDAEVILQLPTELFMLRHCWNPQRRWKTIPDPRYGATESSVAETRGRALDDERRNVGRPKLATSCSCDQCDQLTFSSQVRRQEFMDCVSTASLYSTRCLTRSQCSCRRTGVIWSKRRAPNTRRAAAFWTGCNRRSRSSVMLKSSELQ